MFTWREQVPLHYEMLLHNIDYVNDGLIDGHVVNNNKDSDTEWMSCPFQNDYDIIIILGFAFTPPDQNCTKL